ncbi:hypothetical protein C475_20642 [Halosimplex carlsbadense 2-9-1]|uniref:DUF7344 domain-containing protein n=1 Tax=Halosimplex carlsbadense 2-9-1 TaxID=797114 RepID=M0CAF4_9EURY|nr:hypothetical protein [Halosimplex carlsbadense]ELZ20220.1 hypothetical protein C475_20642 [Halosimplex carlsbadense 2-9-1]
MSERSGSSDGGRGRTKPAVDDLEGDRPFIDTVFEALSDWRRREVCQFFKEGDVSTATVDELAMLLAASEPAGLGEPRGRSHDEFATELVETHLPRLDAAGVVDYDDRSDTVRYWGQPTVEKWLDHVTEVDGRNN